MKIRKFAALSVSVAIMSLTAASATHAQTTAPKDDNGYQPKGGWFLVWAASMVKEMFKQRATEIADANLRHLTQPLLPNGARPTGAIARPDSFNAAGGSPVGYSAGAAGAAAGFRDLGRADVAAGDGWAPRA